MKIILAVFLLILISSMAIMAPSTEADAVVVEESQKSILPVQPSVNGAVSARAYILPSP